MAASNGRAVIVEIDGTDVASQLRTKNLSMNNEPVDITTDGDDGWVNTLDGEHNVKRIVVTIEGVEKDDTFSALAFSGDHVSCVVTNAALETFTGAWQFTDYSIGAPHNGEKTFSVTMSSVGPITVASVPA